MFYYSILFFLENLFLSRLKLTKTNSIADVNKYLGHYFSSLILNFSSCVYTVVSILQPLSLK